MFYSASQRRGVIFLLIIISLFILYHLYYNLQRSSLKPLSILNNIEHFNKINKVDNNGIDPLNSNPNLWSKRDWSSLGFTKRQAEVILNFKNKIGGFKTKKQLFKCYAINKTKQIMLDSLIKFPTILEFSEDKMNLFLLLKSKSPNYELINFFDTIYLKKTKSFFYYFLKNDSSNIKEYKTSKYQKTSKIKLFQERKERLIKLFKKQRKDSFQSVLDINSADSLKLMNIKGIGPKTANQIINYRKKLGGFNNVNQLKEVYLVSDSLFKKVENQFQVISGVVKLIINTDNPKLLISHPYINWNIANAIVNYRFQHGNYSSINKIKEIHLVNEEIYRKIAPYLKIM